ncbi:redoxin domain-containing protein [Rhizobium sp. CRIBSB]|nr:redoxin domain-containing protein [Rhizobium sp. CRIBSB]
MTEILAGHRAPGIDMPTDDGGTVSFEALTGRTVVLYFYPKADTPGCTDESRDFSDLTDAFGAAGAVVVGVSRDPVRKLARFREKHGLKVLLGSDEAGTVTEAWGVWVEKAMYGRTYMGIERATFIISPDGLVAHAWHKVKVKGHAAEVLATITGK